MTTRLTTQWLVIADGRTSSLYECHTSPGSMTLAPVGMFVNIHAGTHEVGRPCQLGGAERAGSRLSSGAAAAPHTVAEGHAAEEERRRFANDLVGWIDSHAGRHPGRIVVFAGPRQLGLLREVVAGHAAPSNAERIALYEGDLSPLNPDELAAHSAVREAMAAGLPVPPKRRRRAPPRAAECRRA